MAVDVVLRDGNIYIDHNGYKYVVETKTGDVYSLIGDKTYFMFDSDISMEDSALAIGNRVYDMICGYKKGFKDGDEACLKRVQYVLGIKE